MPANAPSFYLEVFFSGLVFYVTDKRKPNGSISKVTHVVLRDGREGHHDFLYGLPSKGGHEETQASDFAHEAKVSVIEDQEIKETPLDDEWVYFEWRDKNNKVVVHPKEAKPTGTPDDVKEHLPDPGTASSFYWVPSIRELGPKNAVVDACYDQSNRKPAVVACVHLAGGEVKTSVFAWVHQFKPKGTNEVEKERWIPRLRFSPESGMPTRVDRAVAEGVTWTVRPPPGATKLGIYKAPFDGKTNKKLIKSYDFNSDKKALVGVTNYSMKRKMPPNEIHPGRTHDYGSLHFEMFYDLLRAPVPPGIRHIPWTPGACKETPEWLANAIPYSKLGSYPVDVGNAKRTNKKPDYETAAQAFAKDDRPICAGSSGS